MKKICFILGGLGNGGAETFTLRFFEYFKGKIDPYVITTSQEGGDLYEKFIDAGVTVIFCKVGYVSPIQYYRLYKLFKREKFDVINDMRTDIGGLTMMVAKFAHVEKRVNSLRHSSYTFKPNAIKMLYMRMSLSLISKYATDITSNSQAAIDFYFPRKAGNKGYDVIPNGVNKFIFEISESKEQLRKQFGLPLDKFIIVHTGRYAPVKNHSMILSVADKFVNENKNVVFVLAGKGTEDIPRRGNVITLGSIGNVPQLLKCSDLYYFPSLLEGLPNALIEAMISGLPFVASNIDTIKECVPLSNHSQLCDPVDLNANFELLKTVVGNVNDKFSCQELAEKAYDAEVNFNKLYNRL